MIKNLFSDDDDASPGAKEDPTSEHRTSSKQVLSLFDEAPPPVGESFSLDESESETMAQTVRRSGLAYSAGIAFVAAVVFMLVLGWGADLLLGSAPWGIVFGIILGSVIGFVQLFRISSQIFKK